MARKQAALKKTAFTDGLEAAGVVVNTGEKTAAALEHFARRTAEAVREVLPLSVLRPMAANPRADIGDVSALVKSIGANGFIGALAVRPITSTGPTELFEVWAGNRRLKAAQEAGLESVPCDIYELTEVQALELNLTEQINRADLTPLEEGLACRALQELSGYPVEAVAAKLGQSTSWVAKRVALCSLAPEVQRALAKGEVTLTVAQAVAALPSQKLQVEALKKVLESQGRPAGEQVQRLREELCRPLKGAPWKLTDADLMPEAGACSECPHNSANNRMPGLFDSAKAAPLCALPSCYGDKVKAAWERKTAKATAAGAKVLSLVEAGKLYPHGSTTLGYGSRYVDAHAVVQEDRSKRTWAQLVAEVPEEARPLLHVAQDGEGKARELYVGDKVLAAVSEHLELKWAKAKEAAQSERAEKTSPSAEQEQLRALRNEVVLEVRNAMAKRMLGEPVALETARIIALAVDDMVEAFAAEVLGRKVKDLWLEKEATISELLTLAWYAETAARWSTWDGFDEGFLTAAKRGGFDVEKMVAAKLSGAPGEVKPTKAGKR